MLFITGKFIKRDLAESEFMYEFTFLAPEWLWLLSAIPFWFLLNYYHYRRSSRELYLFSQQPMNKQVLWPNSLLKLLSLSALIIALAQPAWDPKTATVSEQGRDMIFLLDVSRSMLSADSRPNRLAVAIHAIEQTVNASHADRFGLVVFAGSASIKSPLTNDKAFFNNILKQVDSNAVSYGGTRIEDALFKVLDKMAIKDNDTPAIDLILISDGEDLGSQPERALEKLNQLGVRLIVIGLGDSEFGARVPKRNGDGWVFDQGREYWSKMHTDTLRRLAKGAEQGMFFPIGTAAFDLEGIIAKLRQVWPGESRTKGQVKQYIQGYPYCLWLALFTQILILIGGKKALIASLMLLSFNSQALLLNQEVDANSPKTTAISVAEQASEATENYIETDKKTLAVLTLVEQQQLAQSLFVQYPEQAAQVYRYIASQTQQLTTAISANYNLATSLIHLGEQLSAQQTSLLDDLNAEQATSAIKELFSGGYEEGYDDYDEEMIDPQIYYQEAADILRLVLTMAPNHQASRINLEWLTIVAQQQKNEEQSSADQSEQKKPQESQQSEQKEQEDGEQSEEQTEQKAAKDGKNKGQQAKQSSQSQASAQQLAQMKLPPPSASAEEILQQAKKRDQQDRSPVKNNQKPVEQDW